MSLISRIQKGRINVLKDNETPAKLLVSVALKHELMRECTSWAYGTPTLDQYSIRIMGMEAEWTTPALTKPQLAIRTTKGDIRICPLYIESERHGDGRG